MSCESACGTHPALQRDSEHDNLTIVEETRDSTFSRRHLLKGLSAGLATIGLSSLATSAMAAAVATSKVYIITNTKTDRNWPKVGSAARYKLKMDVAKTEDGGRISIEKQDTLIIITQPKAGVFKAFQGFCTHRLVPIGGISGTNLICRREDGGGHGSTFDTTTGAATHGPATMPLRSYPVSIDPKTGVVSITAPAGTATTPIAGQGQGKNN